jgi:hypothetical protein
LCGRSIAFFLSIYFFSIFTREKKVQSQELAKELHVTTVPGAQSIIDENDHFYVPSGL